MFFEGLPDSRWKEVAPPALKSAEAAKVAMTSFRVHKQSTGTMARLGRLYLGGSANAAQS